MKMSILLQLNQLKPKITNHTMPIKTTYKFTRLFKEIDENVEFFNKTLSDLLNNYGQKDENGEYILTEDGNGVKIKEDKYDECLEKINELNALEANLIYQPIFKIEELENLELSMNELELLMPFIEEN